MFRAEPITVAGPCRIYTDLPRYSARKLNYGLEGREWSLVGQAKAGHGLNRIQSRLPRRSVGSSRRRLVFHSALARAFGPRLKGARSLHVPTSFIKKVIRWTS